KVTEIREASALLRRKACPFIVIVAGLCDEAERTHGVQGTQMDEDGRIEAFEANRSAIGGGGGQGTVREAHIAIIAAFDLDDNRRAAADASEKSRQRNDPLIAIFIGQTTKLARANTIDAAFRPHQTVQGEIVEHHGLAV